VDRSGSAPHSGSASRQTRRPLPGHERRIRANAAAAGLAQQPDQAAQEGRFRVGPRAEVLWHSTLVQQPGTCPTGIVSTSTVTPVSPGLLEGNSGFATSATGTPGSIGSGASPGVADIR